GQRRGGRFVAGCPRSGEETRWPQSSGPSGASLCALRMEPVCSTHPRAVARAQEDWSPRESQARRYATREDAERAAEAFSSNAQAREYVAISSSGECARTAA